MFKNYVKVALRHLLRNKTYVLINTVGMGIAMACCLTAYLLIAYNIEFDDYFDESQVRNMVKVVHHVETTSGVREDKLIVPINLAPNAADEISGIKSFTRFCNSGGILSLGGEAFREGIRFADPSFFDMFPLGLTQGSLENFKNEKSIFLSSRVAKKYFGEEDPIGEVIVAEVNGKKYEAVVGGILAELPLNISFHVDALMPFEVYMQAYDINRDQVENSHGVSALFELTDRGLAASISKQLEKYTSLLNKDQNAFRSISFELVPFDVPIINGEVKGTYLRLPIPTIALFIFSTLGFIILLIACFNLTNTTLALTGKRLKEIGVRKVVGSARSQIAFQFLMEMVFTVFLSVIAGLILAQFLVPQFATMWQLQYGLGDLNKFNLIIAAVVLLTVAAILAGIYPALFNSKVNPITLLKGNRTAKGTNYLTRILLTIQFSLSVIVFIAGVGFTQNAGYQKLLPMGYAREKIMTVSIEGAQAYGQFRNAIIGNPKIESVAGAENHIGPYSSMNVTISLNSVLYETRAYRVGPGYFETVGISLIKGRDFQPTSEADYESTVIVDEAFTVNHGLAQPIENKVYIHDKPYRIIGVVSNHLSGLKQDRNEDHIYFFSKPEQYSSMIVRSKSDDLLAVRNYLEQKWKATFPGRPFESKIQEEIVYEEANGYNNNLKQIFFFITLLGSLLSISGIYAMAKLNIQKRTKEIGVRKVLGASVPSIIQLVNREFMIILGIAAAIGALGGYFLTSALFQDLYAQYKEVGTATLLICSLAVFLVGMATTSSTIFRTANGNPTKALRSE